MPNDHNRVVPSEPDQYLLTSMEEKRYDEVER